MTEVLQGAAATRQALISNALRLFGEYGYNAISTRKIADMANANIGSIAYHFGGKLGLMRACARYCIEAVEEAYGQTVLAPVSADMTPQEARRQLLKSIELFVSPVVNKPDAEEIHIFMMRHLSQKSDAFDLLYSDFVCPAHSRLRQLFARATGRDPETEETRILAFTILGQCMYFKICRNIVQRNMNWDVIGDFERNQIISSLRISLNALIDANMTEKVAAVCA